MRALVTGASGFIGAHVARTLTQAGHQVFGFSRTPPPAEALLERHFAGDLRSTSALAAAAQGCDAIIHVAALYSYRRRDAALMQAINVQGTRNVLEVARAVGVRRLVVTSSSATCGPVRGRPADERDRPPPWELRVPYKRTKLEAERLALAAAHDGLDVVIVNPGAVVGPGDRRPTPTGQMVLDVMQGRIRGYMRTTGLSVVGVRDVARGHLLALERGERGERYLLGGANLPLREIFAIVAEQAGQRPPRLPVPYSAAAALAVLADWGGRATGRESRLLVRDEVRLARLPLYFSSAKAVRELGYAPDSPERALADAVDWFESVPSST